MGKGEGHERCLGPTPPHGCLFQNDHLPYEPPRLVLLSTRGSQPSQDPTNICASVFLPPVTLLGSASKGFLWSQK